MNYDTTKFLGIKIFKDYKQENHVRYIIKYHLKFLIYAVLMLLIQLAALYSEHEQKEIISFEHYSFNYFIAWIGNVVGFYFAYKFWEWLYD